MPDLVHSQCTVVFKHGYVQGRWFFQLAICIRMYIPSSETSVWSFLYLKLLFGVLSQVALPGFSYQGKFEHALLPLTHYVSIPTLSSLPMPPGTQNGRSFCLGFPWQWDNLPIPSHPSAVINLIFTWHLSWTLVELALFLLAYTIAIRDLNGDTFSFWLVLINHSTPGSSALNFKNILMSVELILSKQLGDSFID